jgi:benzoate-CoA ligase
VTAGDWSMRGGDNAAAALLGPYLERWPDRVAVRDGAGAYSFAEIARRADAVALGLAGQALARGDRLALCLHDGVDLVSGFLGAIKAGVAPVPLNTLLTADDYAYVLAYSGAAAAVVSPSLAPIWRDAAARAGPRIPLWVGAPPPAIGPLSAPVHRAAPNDPAFLLYSSGSTGRPKGVVHRHDSLIHTARNFGQAVLGLTPEDVIYSAAKLFFAYGLGNSLTFPLQAGAACVLEAGRVTPEVVWRVLREHGVTVFCGVPTLFASLLASPDFPAAGELKLRLCTSAGEPLPAEISRAWTRRTGVEIVDGIGSTEMLHIFLSNRPGDIRHGVTGRPAPGYEVRLIADHGGAAAVGEIGELHVRGPSACVGYWNNPHKSAATFVEGWVRTGDQFRQTADGDFVYCGRSDDMLKVSGIWVSPAEVESALVEHEAVHEAAVVGAPDADGLVKSRAYVVLAAGFPPSADLADQLKAFAKSRLAPHKYPRQIEFVGELPKTATGKIRRHLLRARAAD